MSTTITCPQCGNAIAANNDNLNQEPGSGHLKTHNGPMTYKKYMKLCLVSFIPLLIAGYIFSKMIIPYEEYASLLCNPGILVSDYHCRNVGELNGKLYNGVKKDYKAWFDVTVEKFDSNVVPYFLVSASQRSLMGAHIIGAQSFAGWGRNVDVFMNTLVGKNAIVHLGIEGNQISTIHDGYLDLYCNALHYEESSEYDRVDCWGDGWSGPINVVFDDSSKAQLDQMKTAIYREIDKKRNDYMLYKIVIYPLFLYVFILLSILVWLTKKAIQFVRAD